MKLVVISHKPCWRSAAAPSGFATDGGFPFQMRALSELFDATRLVVPCVADASHAGELPLAGQNLTVRPLSLPAGQGFQRKVRFLWWLVRNGPLLAHEVARADAVHVPVPGDVGTIGMLLALVLSKPLFVRHCGNWLAPATAAEHCWKWLMERFAGGRNVMLATGGHAQPPSRTNPHVRWIFSTTLTRAELAACRRRRVLSSRDNPRLIIACRQDQEKGTGVVIESLPAILSEFPQATLAVLGDGPDLPKFRALAAGIGLSERVRFHGKVGHAEVLEQLQQADLFCYPTRASEGFPKVVLEALACGLPVITTRISVLPELIERGGGGLLIEAATPRALAQAVCAVAGDAARYQTMSRAAAAIAQQYALENWRDEIGEQLRAAWSSSRAGAALKEVTS